MMLGRPIFLIRADGNAVIGAGHMMRCMSIAEELRRIGDAEKTVCFVCADEASAAMAEAHGFESYCLKTDYKDMESEFPAWRELLAGLSEGGGRKNLNILVDSYYVTDSYLAGLKGFGTVILMDDLGRRCFPVDCVVNYNAPARQAVYEKLYEGRNTRLLVGSSYIPLRRQFLEARKKSFGQQAEEEKRPAGSVPRVLITTGGGDICNIGGRILEEIYQPGLEFDLVLGRFSPHYNKMKALEETCENVHICCDVTDMAELMLRADIALTAGGSTVYELAALGVPFICFSYAENQEQLVEYVGREGIAGSAGAWHRDDGGTLDRIRAQFQELLQNDKLRARYRQKEMAMADGHGAERLAAALTAHPAEP